ncbi:hypothetical protein Avbf_15005 [Armadillidium vulgare]|nr:hypothetical protein Avbf_15005 [Armadillidium vulgare]
MIKWRLIVEQNSKTQSKSIYKANVGKKELAKILRNMFTYKPNNGKRPIKTLITGSLITGLAVFASYSHSLIDISISITMPFQGSVFGIFLIGYFYPKCNLIGIWAGIILSLVLNLWMSIGGMINKGKPEMLPFSAEECENGNFTAIIQSVTNNLTLDVNITKENTTIVHF